MQGGGAKGAKESVRSYVTFFWKASLSEQWAWIVLCSSSIWALSMFGDIFKEVEKCISMYKEVILYAAGFLGIAFSWKSFMTYISIFKYFYFLIWFFCNGCGAGSSGGLLWSRILIQSGVNIHRDPLLYLFHSAPLSSSNNVLFETNTKYPLLLFLDMNLNSAFKFEL